MLDLTKPIVIDVHTQRPGSSTLLWALFFALYEITQDYHEQNLVAAGLGGVTPSPEFVEKLEAPLDLVPTLNDVSSDWDPELHQLLVDDLLSTLRLKMTELLGGRHVFGGHVEKKGIDLHAYFVEKREEMCMVELERNASTRDLGFVNMRNARLDVANALMLRFVEATSQPPAGLAYHYVHILYAINHIDRLTRFLRTVRHRGSRTRALKGVI